MKTDHPSATLIPQLRKLWKEAFGDSDAFLDIFFTTAFDPQRCLCTVENGRVMAALYWFDVSCAGQRFAYVYAVATAKAGRGRGLCRKLMGETAEHLNARGFKGILLVPQDEGLRNMYGKMGYSSATTLSESICAAAEDVLPVTEISAEAYAARRISLLPPGSVIQEGENLSFLSAFARFYAAPGLLAAVSREAEQLRILEFLGDPALAPGLVAALGTREAILRRPGAELPFAMYLPLAPDCVKPAYFAFCFD